MAKKKNDSEIIITLLKAIFYAAVAIVLGIWVILKWIVGLFVKKEPRISIKYEVVSTPPSKEELRIRELKKQATVYKTSDINKAVELMREAISLQEKSRPGDVYAFNDYIRLAKYIYLSGNRDEAWEIYNQLLIRAARIKEATFRYGAFSDIYSAMALQTEREKHYKNALLNYLLAGFCFVKSQKAGVYFDRNRTTEWATSGAINGEEEEDWNKRAIDDFEKWPNFIYDSDRPYFKGDKYPDELQIRSKILDEYGGWEKFRDNLDHISLADFGRKVNNIIQLH